MNRRLRVWIVAAPLALLVAACPGDHAAARLAPLAPEARILAFGDSLTDGYGADPGKGYPAQLARLIGRRVVESGVNGETTAEGLARLPGALDRVAPDLLLLCLGGNDLVQRLDPARIEANLARMIELAQERGIAVVLVGVPTLTLVTSLHGAELYERLAQRYGVPLENEVFASVLSDRTLLSDRIHPNARGYERIAQAIADLLRAAGAV
jgi:acyl-CoA thioesterase I